MKNKIKFDIVGSTKFLAGTILGLGLAAPTGSAQSIYTPYTFTTIAGQAGVSGSANGTNAAATFGELGGMALDKVGNLYVADYQNEIIRQVTPVGTNWVVTTLAGKEESIGSADGTNNAARFNGPSDVASDGAGNLFVADFNNNTIRQMTRAGTNWVVTTLAGRPGFAGSEDGTNGTARFHGPNSVALGSTGNLYVVDEFNYTIRKLTPVGTNWVVTTLAGKAGVSGSTDGTNGAARFFYPGKAVVDSTGNLYVTDDNQTIREVKPVGTNWVVTTLAGRAGDSGGADGTGSAARFYNPYGLALDSSGNIYVADYYNYTIRKMTRIGTNWVVTTLAGRAGTTGSANGTGSKVLFIYPYGLALDPAGNLYVTDSLNYTIRKGHPALAITASGRGLGFPGSDAGFNGGQFDFNLAGPSGQSVVVEASADLVSWLPVWTNTLGFPTEITFVDPQSGGHSNRYYRAVTQ